MTTAPNQARLINLAYRLLGSLADAEDAVQEAYARWYAMPEQQRNEIVEPAAWLTKVTSRICLDILGSARNRRERYVGQWLPEPVPDPGETADPADRITLDESVNMAFLVVLESMTPAERVAFILHDVFRYPFADIAEVAGRTPAACRQLASSARRRIDASTIAAPSTQQADIVREFKQAWAAKDINALVELLDPDATMTGDGGGLVVTLPHPLEGGENIANAYVTIAAAAPGMTILERTVNGMPGLIAQRDGVTVSVYAFHLVNERIKHIWVMRNPEKLRAWSETVS